MKNASLIASLVLLPLLSACGSKHTPEQLASDVEAALQSGDIDAFAAQIELAGVPPMMHSMILGTVDECSGEMRCSITVAAVDAEFETKAAREMERDGAEMPYPIAGLLELKGEPRDAGDGNGYSMSARMPFALVGDRYRIVVGRYTEARIAELQATTAESAAAATLERGVINPETGSIEPGWVDRAERLPAGGGEVGEAWLARTRAVAAAAAAGDPDAAWEASGEWGRRLFGKTDYFGKEVPMESRKRQLRAEQVRMVVDAEVLGGYRLDDLAVLIIEGRNGVGGIVRGAQFVKLTDSGWDHAGIGHHLVEIPAG